MQIFWLTYFRGVSLIVSLIRWNQSAFVEGRKIIDNILLPQDYHNKGGKPMCAIKVDIKKDFDSIDWRIVAHVLIAMDFPIVCIEQIKECISIARFFVIINGKPFLLEGKGLSKVTPYFYILYVLCIKVLTQLLH